VRSAILYKQLAFVRRGFLLDCSYRAAIPFRLVAGIVPLLFFFFLKELVSSGDPRLQKYGGDYFAFATIGVALSQYFASALGASIREVRNAQMSGVLEMTLSTATSPFAVLLHGAVYQFLFASLQFTIVLLAAVLGFGLDLSSANWTAFSIGFFCATMAFLGLSIVATGFVIHTKNAEPVQLVLGGLSSFLAGAYFPVAVFPSSMQELAELIPMTHALEVLRATLLTGATVVEVGTSLRALVLLGAILMGMGLWVLSWVISRARRDGTLGQY